MNRRTVLTAFLLILLVAAIAGTIYIIVAPHPGEPFTELYLLGPGGKASDYPTNLTVGQQGTVIVGVVNHENADTPYRLHVTFGNATVSDQSFTLVNNQKWEKPLTFNATQRGTGQKIEFDLYKDNGTTVYRSVYLYVTVT